MACGLVKFLIRMDEAIGLSGKDRKFREFRLPHKDAVIDVLFGVHPSQAPLGPIPI